MTKEEKIIEAYGESWDKLHPAARACALKNNGWIGSIISHPPIDVKLTLVFQGLTFRPKSLEGIETNNGWVKIYRKNDLPQMDCDLFVLDKETGLHFGRWELSENEKQNEENRTFWVKNVSHYKILNIKKPLY
jgi:hypothetical protein